MLESDSFRYHPCTHAGTLQHLNSLDKEYRFEIAAACDLSLERLKTFKEWWKTDTENIATDVDFRNILDQHEIDLLIISSSFSSHHEICRYALEKKVKAIVLEKPAVENIKEIQELLEISVKNGIPIWINFERRYHNGYREVKKFIDQKILGDLRSINGKVLTGSVRPEDEGSPLLLDGIHWFDILLWFFGKPDITNVSGKKSEFSDMYDTAVMQLNYGEVPVFFEAGGKRKYFEFFMEIDFEKGRIRTGNEGQFFYRSELSKRYENFYELTLQNIKIEKNNPWIDMYEEVADYILNKEKKITSPLQDSLLSLELYSDVMRNI